MVKIQDRRNLACYVNNNIKVAEKQKKIMRIEKQKKISFVTHLKGK